MTYEKALKSHAAELKTIWGNLIQRTWHMANQTWTVVTALNRMYKVEHWQICRDLSRLIGNISTDTMWGYFVTISKIREIKATNLITKPFTGFTQAKAVCTSGVSDADALRILQWAYANDAKRNSKKISVQEIKAQCEITLGLEPSPEVKRVQKFASVAVAAVALRKYMQRLFASFPETEKWPESNSLDLLAKRLERA